MRTIVLLLMFVLTAPVYAQLPLPPPTGPPATQPMPKRGIPLPEPQPLEPATPRDEAEPGPRIPADYAGRAALAMDPTFQARVTTAMLTVADDVLAAVTTAPPANAPADPRLSLVGTMMRDPDHAGRKMARLVAANIPATMLVGGSRPQTPLTDDELTAVIAARWTALAYADKPPF